MRRYVLKLGFIILFLLSTTTLASAATVPTWVNNLPFWQWYSIPNTALSSVEPNPRPLGVTGPSSKIVAWNGATLKRQGSVYLIGAAGGHGDYAGNEVDALQLNTENPQWVQISAPSADSQVINNSQFYLDLKPSPTHTYYASQFINARNRMLVMPSPGMLLSGLPNPPSGWAYTGDAGYSFSFNVSTNTWDAPEFIARYSGGGDFTAALVVKHPTTEDIYYNRYGAGWWKWTQSTNSWSRVSANNEAGNYAAAAIDPGRNRMLVVGSYGATVAPRVRDLNGNLISASFGGLGSGPLTLSGYPGIVYDETNDKFLVFYNSGSGIRMYRVDAATWFVDAPSVTGTLPSDRQNGIQNSVQYVPELGGVVIANSYTGNVMFMRTSGGGGTTTPPPPDTTPPTTPSGLSVTAISSSQIDLSWNASTDNVGVTGYRVYRGGVQIGIATNTSYQDTGLSASTQYSYTVAAADAAGNLSSQTNAVSATTQARTSTPPSGLPSLTLTSTSSGIKPFAVGHVFKQGDVPGGSTISANVTDFQATIKNTWPDGSARFAILSGRASLTANTPLAVNLTVAAPQSGTALTEADLANTGITASIQFGSVGTVNLTDLIGVTSTLSNGRMTPGRVRTWVSGPKMSSWIYYSRIGSDPLLSAWFEVRLWSDGSVEVLPWVENSTLNVTNPSGKGPATVTFTLGGSQRYSGTLTLGHHTRAVLGSGSTFSHWLGTNPAVTPKHDVAYLQATKMVPTYRGTTASNSALWSRIKQTYTPLTEANVRYVGMGSAGYAPFIGPLPEWDVAYLTSQGDSRALASVTVNAYAAGGFDIHFRDETTNQPPKFSSYPNLLIGDNEPAGLGTSSTNTFTPTASGTSGAGWDTPHHPSLGYMAYLLLGRFYFLEETQFVSTMIYLQNTDTNRQFSQGVLRTDVGALTTRGAAWALRTLVQAAAITPDGDALQTELLNSWANNIAYYHAKYVAQPNNPQGWAKPYSNYNDPNSPYYNATWMEDFLTFSFGFGSAINLNITTANKAKLDALFAWKAQSIIGRLGGSGATEFYFADAAQYVFPVASSASSNWDTGSGPWYNNFGEAYNALKSSTNPNGACSLCTGTGNSLRGGNFPDATSYWGNLQPAISYAVQLNVTGATAAYNRMIGATNWSQLTAGFNDDPVWGVAPSSTSGTPPPPPPSSPSTPSNLSVQ